MRRRGLTLIELLLVVALLLAAAAIALPSVYTAFRERAFESSAELLRAQLLMARAHAQATGRPVEVGYDVDPPCVLARYFDPEAPGGGTAGAATVPIPSAWADRPLPDGVWVADRSADDGTAPDASGTPVAAAAPVRLAVFMPDGSALFAETAWICDGHGRLGRVDVNPWTGMPAYERGAPGAMPPADEPAEPAEPDEPDEPPEPGPLPEPGKPAQDEEAGPAPGDAPGDGAVESPPQAGGDGEREPGPPAQEEDAP